MPSLTFVDMVRNERSMFSPLLSDRPTNRIRRALFQGKVVGTDQFDHAHFGGSHALINQVCGEMERWGFEFERPKGDDGRKGFKLKNPLHEPTVRAPRPAGPPRRRREPRPAAVDAPANGKVPQRGTRPGEQRGDLRRAIRAVLMDGEAMSLKDCMKRFDCTEGNLREVVKAMKKEGYQFDEYRSSTGKTFLLKRSSKALAQQRAHASNGNGHEDNPRLPVLAFPPDGEAGSDLEIPPLPAFGTHVQMVGQFLTPDGDVNLMFRDADGDQWLTSIEGHSVTSVDKG